MIDMSIGNPSIFSLDYENTDLVDDSTFLIGIKDNLGYNKQGCIAALENRIRKLHHHHRDTALDIRHTNAQILVGHGATQIYMGMLQYASARGGVTVDKPYWFRTVKMAAMRSCEIVNSSPRELVTIPNNPDGRTGIYYAQDYIDTVYNWPWYYPSSGAHSFNNYKHTLLTTPSLALFSLGKMSGHCGSRLGWAQINDPDLYDFLKDYVEYDSGGVSIEAQLRAVKIIDYVLDQANPYYKFQRELEKRKHTLKTSLNPSLFYYLDYLPGMFAWLTAADPGLDMFKHFSKLGIKVTPGVNCGGNINQCRINLGESKAVWDAFIDKVRS